MGEYRVITWVVALTILLGLSGVASSQAVSTTCDIAGFLRSLPGSWVGTVTQSTEGKPTDTRYFRATAQQTACDTYCTRFVYYKLDQKTGAMVPAGAAQMTTKVDPGGTATNCVTGKGEILVDANTWKPETHELNEVLRMGASGGLEGTGSGSICISGMPLGLGKNGTIQSYSSAWSANSDSLKITQSFKLKFRALIATKSYAVTVAYSARRGTDLSSAAGE